MSENKLKPLGRQTDIVIQELNNEILIYDLTTHKAFSLNETSALVWQACDGNKTIGEISEQVGKHVNSPVSEDFIWLALEQLKKENLLENKETVSDRFEGLSRREVIRKIGFASIITLPLVSSLIAPTAAQAQSAAVCALGSCRCPNASVDCNGTSGSFGGTTFINCFTISGGDPDCNCVGPFGPANGAGSGFKAGVGCRTV